MFGRGGRRVVGLFVISILLLLALPLAGQGAGPFVAFVNSAGQLVVSSGDGGYRWIVTNPGETLNRPLGYAWSPDQRQLFYALSGAGDVSLRVADIASQTAVEIGRAAGQVSGGTWTPDGRAVLIGMDNRVVAYPVGGGGPVELAAAQGPVALRSPLGPGSERPNLAPARTMDAGGQFLFYAQGNSNVVQPVGGAPVVVPGGDPNSPFSGLWATNGPLVAYSGFNGNSTISVTHAATGATVTLDSGRTAPINPLAWRPGSAQLIYRDASNAIRIADLSCLQSGCPGNPLESGVELLPASATDVQTDGAWVYFVDGGAVKATSLNCVGSGACLQSAIILGSNVAPQTFMDIGGTTLAYTASNDPYNPADREVRVVDLRCLGNPASCQAVPVLGSAINGLVSPDGQYVVVEPVGGGLSVLRLFDRQVTYLSDPAGQSLLPLARWAG